MAKQSNINSAFVLYSDNAADFNKLEYGSGTICAGVPSSPGFGVGGQSYSNFLAYYCRKYSQ